MTGPATPGSITQAWLRMMTAVALLLNFAPHNMNASNTGLHPLDQPLPAGLIQFTLRDTARAGEPVAIECVYRPCRERDVSKQRSLHLLGSPFRIGSGLSSVQREEFHTVRQESHPTNTTARFSVALRDPDAEHERYQLASVRVVSGAAGTLEFERWSPATPVLDPGFGLVCATEKLTGTIRPSGLGARPLTGKLPLWPTLRIVDLTFTAVPDPTIQLWDAAAKHHWDGWRQSTPEPWPGGSTIVARHIKSPTVWRSHDYFAFLPADAPSLTRPSPPAGALPGVALEIFWPEGDTLEFPEIRFEGTVDMIGMPLSRLTARAREILALSTTLRPGLEHHSISTAEGAELDALSVDHAAVPVAAEMSVTADGKDRLLLKRGGKLTEPWLLLFGADYDTGRRYSFKAIVIHPQRWTGPLPE